MLPKGGRVTQGPDRVIPLSFDLSTLVSRSVATLYSHLVTRPTGRALRLGIESQIGELGSHCLSILDFTQVVVLDYSCADEAVAKLLQHYQPENRPANAFFVARGLGEQHRDPLEAVLGRHGLALVAEVGGVGYTLLGRATEFERAVWGGLQRLTRGAAGEVAGAIGAPQREVATALTALAARRTILEQAGTPTYVALSTLLPGKAG